MLPRPQVLLAKRQPVKLHAAATLLAPPRKLDRLRQRWGLRLRNRPLRVSPLAPLPCSALLHFAASRALESRDILHRLLHGLPHRLLLLLRVGLIFRASRVLERRDILHRLLHLPR